MARMFYLSIVYDANGYDRYDIISKKTLRELDKIIANYSNRNEIIDNYLGEYNIDKSRGKVCIIYEDLELKKKELSFYDSVSDSMHKERLKKDFSYAHIIPILYNKRRLLDLNACLLILERKLEVHDVIDSIMLNHVSKKGEVIKTNKRYLFETEEEQDLINNECKYKEAISCFLKRLKNESPDELYFYCRALIDTCELGIKIIRTNRGTIESRDFNMKKLKNSNILNDDLLTDSERLITDARDMESFYLYHDLDEVIRQSKDANRPIGSEGRKK